MCRLKIRQTIQLIYLTMPKELCDSVVQPVHYGRNEFESVDRGQEEGIGLRHFQRADGIGWRLLQLDESGNGDGEIAIAGCFSAPRRAIDLHTVIGQDAHDGVVIVEQFSVRKSA